MKKALILILALLLALLLPALAETAEETVQAAEETVQAAEETVQAAEETVQAAEETAETAEEAQTVSEPPEVIKKLLEQKWYTWAVVAALIAAAILLGTASRKADWRSRRIAMAAMCISIAFVLSCLRLYRMPQGGSVTPASMLPLVMFMLACGPLQGFVAGCAFGLLKLISDPWIIHPVQLLVDYPLSYGMMILGCLAAVIPVKKSLKLPLAVLLGAIGRYAMAVLSGTVFFAEYAGDQNALVYSLVYNVSYLGPDTLVCMVIALIPGMPRLVDLIAGRVRNR